MDLHEMPLEIAQHYLIESEARLVEQPASISDFKETARAPAEAKPRHERCRAPGCPQAPREPSPQLDEPPQDVRALLARQGVALPLYLDTERERAAQRARQAWRLIQARDNNGAA